MPAASDPVPDHVVRCWRGLDARFANVAPTPWGAVVTDDRFPAVWDANYARLDVVDDPPTLREVEAALLPALRAAGAEVQHLVAFDPTAAAPLLDELLGREHVVTRDLVMERTVAPAVVPERDLAARVDEVTDDPALWERVRASFGLFGVDDGALTDQLTAIEREVLAPTGKRWFGIRDDTGTIVSLGAVTTIDDVAYVDNVVTFEPARGRGYATAVAAAIVRASDDRAVPHVCLFADPEATSVVGMYERLGFRAIGELAASRGPATSPAPGEG